LSTIKVNNIQSRTGNAISFTSGDTITIPSGATLTNNGTANFGKIGQVVQGSKTTQFETSSTSFVDSTFSASITPTSTSSKILIMCSTSAIHIATTGAGGETLIKFYRGGTPIGDEYQVAKSRQDSSYNQEVGGGGTAMYLDSPATTSSITYNVYVRITSGSAGRICQAGHGGTLTLMEVLA
jgi:hypothetical protein